MADLSIAELEQLLTELAGGMGPELYSVLALGDSGFRFFPPHKLFQQIPVMPASGVLTLSLDPFTTNVVNMNQNVTSVPFPPEALPGKSYVLVFVQDGTGSRTITGWGSNFLWPGGTAPTLSTAAGSIDILTFLGVDLSGTIYLCGVSQLDFQ